MTPPRDRLLAAGGGDSRALAAYPVSWHRQSLRLRCLAAGRAAQQHGVRRRARHPL